MNISRNKEIKITSNDTKNQQEYHKMPFILTHDGFYFRTPEGHKFGPYEQLGEVKKARNAFIYSFYNSNLDFFRKIIF